MKLIDVMKRYNRCIIKENAKLRSIYNTLIRECDNVNDIEEDEDIEVVEAKTKKDNGNKEKDDDKGTTMSVSEFISECDKKNKETQIDEVSNTMMTAEEFFGTPKKKNSEDQDSDETSDDLISEEDFFGYKKKTDECDKCGDDSCKKGEKCGLKEDEEDEEVIDEDEEDEEVIDEEELISKKEFYANECDQNDKEVNEKNKEELDESINRRFIEANRRLFNF